MRFTLATVLAFLAVTSEVVSGAMISSRHMTHAHARLARRTTRQKRCIQRNPFQSSSSTSAAPAPTSSTVEAPPAPSDTGNNNNNNNNNNNGNNNGGGNPYGTIQSYGSPCDPPNASVNPTRDSGPNGSTNWLTCGITSSGWNPPMVSMDNVIYKTLADILNSGNNTPFEACRQYVGHFEDAARDTNLPSSLLAAIAMQESSCQPWVTGRAGEIGMMQVTHEKCPSDGSDCYEVRTNIYIGARYLRSRVDANGGNLIKGMGEYNGWFAGMTVNDANNHPCGQRNNLDYLGNVFNGYLQGVDPGSSGMGVFFNVC